MQRDGEQILCSAKASGDSFLARLLANEVRISGQGLYRDDKIIALEYLYALGRNPFYKRHYRFDWQAGLVHTLYENKKATLPLSTGITDSNFLYLRLMHDVARSKKSFDQSYQVVRRGKIRNYRFYFAKEEVLETPLGRFNTWKILREKRGKVDHALWLSPEHAYLPLKLVGLRDSKEQYSAVIQQLEMTHKER